MKRETRYYLDCPNHGTYENIRVKTYNAAGESLGNKTEIVSISGGPAQDPNKVYLFNDGSPDYKPGPHCTTCGEKMVSRRITDTAKPDRERTQCGPKCQNATGPACDCHCRGVNHGTNFAGG